MRSYDAIIPGALCGKPVDQSLVPECREPGRVVTHAAADEHDGSWWAQATQGMDFSHPDRIDTARFNAILATGLSR